MKRAFLFFKILFLIQITSVYGQVAPDQKINLTIKADGFIHKAGRKHRLNMEVTFDDEPVDPVPNCYGYPIPPSVPGNTWVYVQDPNQNFFIRNYPGISNSKSIKLTVRGYLDRCGGVNGDPCRFNNECYCIFDIGPIKSDVRCSEYDDTDYFEGKEDYNKWFNDGIPGQWNYKYVYTTNELYGVRFSYFFTPPLPNYPQAINMGTNNICAGDTIRLKTDCLFKQAEYVWQEMTDGIRWEVIPGQNSNVLTLVVPPNKNGKVIKKQYRVYSRYNGVTSYLPTDFLNTIFIHPDGPHIENTSSFISPTNVKCTGESTGKIKVIRVDGSGSYFYGLKKLDDPSFPILNTAITFPTFPDDAYNKTTGMVGLPKGNYELAIRNGYFSVCTNFIQIPITEPDSLKLSIPSDYTYNGGVNISCNRLKDGKIMLNAKGGVKPYTYYLSDVPDFSSNKQSSANQFGGLGAGFYYLKVKDNNGCFSNIQKDTLIEPSIFKSSVLAFDAKCNGSNDGVISFVNSTGGTLPYYYSVDNYQTYQTNVSINQLGPASYICHAKDANGCEIKDTTVSISEPDEFVIKVSNIQEATCFDRNDASFSVNASGGTPDYKFSLDEGDYFDKSDFAFISGGNHILRIKDQNECIDTLGVYVGRPDSIAIDFDITEVQCAGFNNGVIKTNVSGGTKPYTYQWQNFPDKDTLLEKLSPGEYYLTITDNHHCEASNNAKITEPSNQLEVSFTTKIDPKCNIECNGQLEVVATGGTAPYYYRWNEDSILNTTMLNNLCQGIYNARIIDSRSCVAFIEAELKDSVQFAFSIPDSTIICPGKQVTFDAGNAGFDYEWRDEHSLLSKAQIFTTHTDGTYQLKLKNADGCYAEKTFKLKTSKELLNAQFLLPSFVEYGDTVVFVEVSKPLPDSIQWSFSGEPVILDSPKGSPELYFGKPGSYSIKLTAFLGECTDSIRKTITFFIPPVSVGGNDSLGLGLNKIKAIKIFPNPNNGIFNAQIDLDKEQAIEIEILNSQGLPISKASYIGQENYLLNFSLPLGTGVYLMKILTPTDFRTIGFIVN